MPTPTRFFVSCRRWFDGCNTYHSVLVHDMSGVLDTMCEPFAYGYGDGCLQTARDLIETALGQPAPKLWSTPGFAAYDICDVANRSHLHMRGKRVKPGKFHVPNLTQPGK